MNFSVCIDSVFSGYPIDKALKNVKEAGFDTYEFWTWWDKDIDRLSALQSEHGIKAKAFCTRFISLTDASKRALYLDGLKKSLEAAKKLDCNILIAQVGNTIPEMDDTSLHDSVVQGLKECVSLLCDFDITLAIEPLNTVKDHKGYYLSSAKEAFEMIDEVGSTNVKVLYDLYHQKMTGDLSITDVIKNIDKIAHFHAAGCPGRNELDSGTMEYKNIFKAIYDAGYKGHIGLEYFPKDDPQTSLKKVYSQYLG